MNNLYNPADVERILNRIEKLSPHAEAQWGKMSVSQMLAHCNLMLEAATGKKFPRRKMIGRIVSPFVKSKIFSEKPMGKNLPTDRRFVVKDEREFSTEKKKILNLIKDFYEGGPNKCTKHPHPFFGKLSPDEWAVSQWKHLDHHLRQFGS